MIDFMHYLPTRFVFGRNAAEKAGEMVKLCGGTRALIHYGGGSVVRSGLLNEISESLEKAGVEYVLLGGAQPNPLASKVYEGIHIIRENRLDFIMAVGGGSVIDSAKAMALGAVYEGDFWDFFNGDAKPTAHLPVGVAVTLAASGSESSNSAVITKDETLEKRGLNVELNRPVFALMNPEWTYTLPDYQTACGATDIMAHVLERYFTREQGVDLTDRMCEAVLSAVIVAAQKALQKNDDYDARAQLMWAGTIAHNDTVGVGRLGDWASHRIEHELSAKYGVAHGAGLAVLFPAWMRRHVKNDPERFARLAVNVWGCEPNFFDPLATALQGIERFEAFLKSIGMPITLRELGVPSEDIPALAQSTRKDAQGMVGQFVRLDVAAIEEVLRIADK